MAKKENSFSYYQNDLPLRYSQYDVYCSMVARYQEDRTEQKWPEGSLDDHQLIRERYTDRPVFISHTEPTSPTTLLFVNRANGYMAYTNSVPSNSLDPFSEIECPVVGSFFEYLSYIKGTQYEGFFTCQGVLSCYATISDDVYIVTSNGEISLLFFAEQFVYTEDVDKKTGRSGIAVLSSPYYDDITIHVYTKDSVDQLEKYTVYAKTSSFDPNPVGKIPGEPIYKTLIISQWDESVTALEINNTSIDLTQKNRIIAKADERFHRKGLMCKHIGNGQVEIGFTLPFKNDPLTQFNFTTRLMINGEWSEATETTVYLIDNKIHSLTPTITVDPQELYLNVPTEYTLRVDNRYFYTTPTAPSITILYYLDSTLRAPIHYQGFKNSHYVYTTDFVTVPQEEGKKPNEYLFLIEGYYEKINDFTLPIWVYGYTTNEVNRIPDDFILVTQTPKDTFIYNEYERHTYAIEFSYRGTLKLVGVELKRVTDDYGYFTTSDFTLEKVSEGETSLTYQLVLDKKIIATPQNINQLPLRILFSYKVQRKDLSEFYWPADTLTVTMKINYEKERFELIVDDIDNKLLGDATIRYRLKDKFLGKFTDKYSDDERLVVKGSMTYSSNIKDIDKVMGWDIRAKQYLNRVSILRYGDISVQFKGIKTTSNLVVVSHEEPVHPLKVNVHLKDVYVDSLCRVVIDLNYIDDITAIYNDGNFVGQGTSIALNNVKNGYGSLFPIYTADKTKITGIGLDVIALEEGTIDVNFLFNGVNDYDYSNWPKKVQFTLNVKPQSDIVNFTFTLTDFEFGRASKGILKLNDTQLADGKVIATVKNAENDIVVAKPNFNPVGGGDFTTINLFIDDYLSNQKSYYLDFEITEYLNASKDNDAPNRYYYHVKIPFEVS